MQLIEAVGHLKKMQNIFKAFSKVEEVMLHVSKLEGREQELKRTMNFLKIDYDDMAVKHKAFGEKLRLKQESVGAELTKIENMVHTKKVEAFAVLDGEVAKSQKILANLNVEIESKSSRINELGHEERDLTDKVKALKKVIAEVSGIKGVA